MSKWAGKFGVCIIICGVVGILASNYVVSRLCHTVGVSTIVPFMVEQGNQYGTIKFTLAGYDMLLDWLYVKQVIGNGVIYMQETIQNLLDRLQYTVSHLFTSYQDKL